jgi:hypothetical protein
MTWKLYSLASGGLMLATAVAAVVAPIERNAQNSPTAVPQAIDRLGSTVDLGAQADHLKAKLAEVISYQRPARNAFQFRLTRPVVELPKPSASEAAPVVVAPSRPPYGLAGMATTADNGVTVRTAILSSLQGVSLVREGDTLETGYRVLSISEDAVVLESPGDGTRTTLHLSN